MNRYLNVLNQLQDIFTECGVSIKEIELPQIAVVGCQSAGKSSVLESIAKQDLLPRGSGIVTRRPLVLQMINETKPYAYENKVYDTWAFFNHLKNNVFFDMRRVQDEITRNTNEVCGVNKGVSDIPILLKLHSTKIPSLTLIDLPGLTKIPVGDQPKDIDRQIEKLVRSYVQKENTIILAISPGNVDIANSDSLRLAREIDPRGLRTLAVITKVDLMEDTEESLNLLQGRSVNMRLGLVGVMNRSKKHLDNGMSPEEGITVENKYLTEKFPSLCGVMGTPYLSKKLCNLLIKTLKEALPSVSEKVNRQLEDHQNLLKELGPEITDKKLEVMNLVMKFNSNLRDSFSGMLTTQETKKTKKTEVRDGVKLPVTVTLFYSAGSKLKVAIERHMAQLDEINIEESLKNIDQQISASCGYQPPLFVADSVFSRIVSEKIKSLDEPVMAVINAARETIDRVIKDIGSSTFVRFPTLEAEVVMYARQEVQAKVEQVQDFMKQFLAIQQGYINTSNPEFDERYTIASSLFKDGDTTAASSSDESLGQSPNGRNLEQRKKLEEREVKLMIKLVVHYFDITRKMVKDSLHKAIIRTMVLDLTETCNITILSQVLQTEAESLLCETQDLDIRRNHSKKMIETLTKAIRVMSNIGYR